MKVLGVLIREVAFQSFLKMHLSRSSVYTGLAFFCNELNLQVHVSQIVQE